MEAHVACERYDATNLTYFGNGQSCDGCDNLFKAHLNLLNTDRAVRSTGKKPERDVLPTIGVRVPKTKVSQERSKSQRNTQALR